MAKKFTRYYKKKCRDFILYFQKNYLNRSRKWAMCYRAKLEHGNTNTTMYVESFHNKLKTVEMKRIPNRRIDDLIEILIGMEQKNYRRHLLDHGPEPVEEDEVQSRHMSGMKISVDDVNDIGENKWIVKSQTNDESYEVIFLSLS